MKLIKLLVVLVSFLFLAESAAAQNESEAAASRGQLYFTWGYNRDWYSASNIHIYRHDANPANSYDFMLYNAKAHDKPDMWRWWNPERLTIPQYDLNIGYFFKKKPNWGIEVGWNHLKYVVTDWQNIHLQGQIHGVPVDRVAPLDPDTIHLQHTNGNNYLLVSVIRKHTLLTKKNFQVTAIAKAGIGPLISYTIDTILGDYDPGYFHYHGYVAAASLGVRANFSKHFFVQTDLQGGGANYTNTKLGHEHLGTAVHHFYSLQWTYEVGYTLPIGKK